MKYEIRYSKQIQEIGSLISYDVIGEYSSLAYARSIFDSIQDGLLANSDFWKQEEEYTKVHGLYELIKSSPWRKKDERLDYFIF